MVMKYYIEITNESQLRKVERILGGGLVRVNTNTFSTPSFNGKNKELLNMVNYLIFVIEGLFYKNEIEYQIRKGDK